MGRDSPGSTFAYRPPSYASTTAPKIGEKINKGKHTLPPLHQEEQAKGERQAKG